MVTEPVGKVFGGRQHRGEGRDSFPAGGGD